MADMKEALLTTEEVAERYRISVARVAQLVREGRLTCLRMGDGKTGRLRFRRSDIDAFEERSAAGVPPPACMEVLP
jgi:excisionase family DNA binding protein